MCISAAVLSTLKIGMAAMSTIGSAVAANETANRQNEMYQTNAMFANQDAAEKYAQNNLQQIQTEAQAAQERMNNKINVTNAKGTALASTENLGGSSTNTVLNDIARQGARKDNVTNVNVGNAKAQMLSNTTSIKNEAEGRIASVGQAEGPSLIQTAISGLGNITPYVGDYKGTDRGGHLNKGQTK